MFIKYNLDYGKETSVLKFLIESIENKKEFHYDAYRKLITLCYNRFGNQEDSDEYFIKIINSYFFFSTNQILTGGNEQRGKMIDGFAVKKSWVIFKKGRVWSLRLPIS